MAPTESVPDSDASAVYYQAREGSDSDDPNDMTEGQEYVSVFVRWTESDSISVIPMPPISLWTF